MLFIKANGGTVHGQYMKIYGFTYLIFSLSNVSEEAVQQQRRDALLPETLTDAQTQYVPDVTVGIHSGV